MGRYNCALWYSVCRAFGRRTKQILAYSARRQDGYKEREKPIMKNRIHSFLFLLLVPGFAMPAMADERPDHFEGKQAETLEQALANFSEYNAKLDALLAQETLSATDLGRIHELTYTLENALAKINAEFSELAENLEEIHMASEAADAETVKSRGRIYLNTATKVVK